MTETPYDVNPQNNQSTSPSSISILSNIIMAPQKAFKDIQIDYPILLPFLSIVILNALLVVTLYANIDYAWFVDHMVESQAGDLSKAEQNQARQAFDMMSASAMGGVGAASIAVVMAVVFCVIALYFVIVSSITDDGFQFKQWLSLVTWASIPSLVGTLASFVVIFTATNGQIAPESLNPITLNELFFGMNAAKGLGNILATTDITVFWSIALMTIGYSQWTEKSLGKSFAIVFLPYAAYYAIRLLML